MAVFLFHLNADIGWRPLRAFFFGQAGVAFFYVLSGFVLTWSIREDSAPLRFFQRRFARIYPATLAMGLVAAALTGGHQFGVRGGLLGAVTSILLVQAWFPGSYPVYSYNPVAWSLSCEAFFYALLPALVVAASGWTRRLIAVVACGFLMAGFASTLALARLGHGSDIAFNDPLARLPEFILGVAIGLLVIRGWRPRLSISHAVPLLLGCIVAAHFAPSAWFPIEDYVMLPGIVLLLLAGITADLRGQSGPLTARLSVYLGELSFCFYLVHYLVLRVLVSEAGWANTSFSLVGGVVPMVVAFAACVAAAVALHHVVELPLQRLLRPGLITIRTPTTEDRQSAHQR